MKDYIRNIWLQRAEELATLLLKEPKIGIIVGKPGTGKTIISLALADTFDGAIRVCCAETMSTPKDLIISIAKSLGMDIRAVHKKSAQQLLMQLLPNLPRLIILDEANFLRTPQIETIRGWVDEHRISVLFVGTEIFLQTLQKDSEEYLAQFNGRIGNRFLNIKNYQLPIKGKFRNLWLKELTDQFEYYFPVSIYNTSPSEELVTAWFEKTNGNFRLAEALCHLIKKTLEIKGCPLTIEVIANSSLKLAELPLIAKINRNPD